MPPRKSPISFLKAGQKIRYYRQFRGCTAARLAQIIDIDSKYLSSLESGCQMPGIKILYRLSVSENLITSTPEEVQNQQLKDQIARDINRYTIDELELLHCIHLYVKSFLAPERSKSIEPAALLGIAHEQYQLLCLTTFQHGGIPPL